jgi:porphobilinogen deaminase
MNVDSLDGLIVAKAALNRLNIQHQNMYTFSEDQMLPAAAQGAIGIEINAIELESDIGNLLKLLNDESTYQATAIERTVVASLEGNCLSPISALCKIEAQDAELKVRVSNQNGSKVYNEAVKFNLDNKIDALQRFIETLIQNGAKEIIQQ